MAFTHYLPALYGRRDGMALAVCETPILPSQHAIEPTCPVCQQWLVTLDLPAPSVTVTPRIGEDTFARATATVLPDDSLEVRWVSGGIARTYRPEDWREAIVATNGHRDQIFISRSADQDRRDSHERTAVIA